MQKENEKALNSKKKTVESCYVTTPGVNGHCSGCV